jgi:hypothetical protein
MKTLTDDDFARAAAALACDVAAVRAVCAIEAPQGGFLATGEPVILFEAHIFSRLTGRRYDATHPSISSRTWNRALYRIGLSEHQRLAEAVALDRDAALQSASWGRFQIMGFNWQRCGFPSLQDFINAMYASEGQQLDAFVEFVKSAGLDDELRRLDWAAFARGYNGPSFAENEYDARLAAAYHSFAPGAVGRVV